MNVEVDLKHVRRRKAWVEYLPGVSASSATALYPNIYVGASMYSKLTASTPDPTVVALIVHEQEHLKRIALQGRLKWYVRYLMSRRFRLEEELAALYQQFAVLKQAKLRVDLEHRARVLSGPLYLWATSYKDALHRLQEIWDSV